MRSSQGEEWNLQPVGRNTGAVGDCLLSAVVHFGGWAEGAGQQGALLHTKFGKFLK